MAGGAAELIAGVVCAAAPMAPAISSGTVKLGSGDGRLEPA